MGGRRRCCCGGCWEFLDNFNRASLGADWEVLSGAWNITSNELTCVTEGVLITTQRQQAPTRGSRYNLRIEIDLIDFPSSGTRAWKIIVGFEDIDNFDFIVLDYDATTQDLIPTFWRRVAGADSKVLDPADFPGTPVWSGTAPGTASKIIFICYAKLQWSASETVSVAGWEVCDGGKEDLPLDPDHGLVGFLGEDGSKFDNLIYQEHWESNTAANDCPKCACSCINQQDQDDFLCLPETLTGTLVPFSGPTCTELDNLAVTFRQASLDETAGDFCEDPATPFDDRAQKEFWVSDLIEIPTNGEQVGDTYYLRLRLTCNANEGYTVTTDCAEANFFVTNEVDVDWSVSTCDPVLLVFPGWEVNSVPCSPPSPGRKPAGCGSCVAEGSYVPVIYDLVIT